MIFHCNAIMSILTARVAALVVSSTSNKVLADNINLDDAIAGSASGSPRSTRTEIHGAECAVVASPETREKDAEMDVGILLIHGCEENEACVWDDTSSLGGRCVMFGAEEGVTKAHHRDLAGVCSGTYPYDCIPCTMLNGTPGKKCDGYRACFKVDTTKISCGSCNGHQACWGAGAVRTIGESSCNSLMACFDQSHAIGSNSCNGGSACYGYCYHGPTCDVGDNKCNGDEACKNSDSYVCPTKKPTANPVTNPTTSNPTTSNPTTSNPTTSNPTTNNPVTNPPTTNIPSTAAPTKGPTANPVTNPTTSNPTTSNPTTSNPTTSNPTTSNPTTSNPTKRPVTASPTKSPVTVSPTKSPVTASPTKSPVTASPTKSPVTASPTKSPVTSSPTKRPVTASPTKSPVTPSPTSKSPTTGSNVVEIDSTLTWDLNCTGLNSTTLVDVAQIVEKSVFLTNDPNLPNDYILQLVYVYRLCGQDVADHPGFPPARRLRGSLNEVQLYQVVSSVCTGCEEEIFNNTNTGLEKVVNDGSLASAIQYNSGDIIQVTFDPNVTSTYNVTTNRPTSAPATPSPSGAPITLSPVTCGVVNGTQCTDDIDCLCGGLTCQLPAGYCGEPADAPSPPSVSPSRRPTPNPTPSPSRRPTPNPTPSPSRRPTPKPTRASKSGKNSKSAK